MPKKQTPQSSNYSTKDLVTRLWSKYLRRYNRKLAISAFFMIIVAITSALHVWLVKPALDQIFISKDKTFLLFLPFMVVTIALIKAWASYFQNYYIKYIGQSIVNDIQLELYEHLLYSDMTFLKAHSSGNLISRFVGDIANLRNALANLFISIARELLTVVFLLGIMFYNDFTLSLIAFVVFPIAIIPIIKMGKRMRKIAFKTQEELGNYTIRLEEIFRNIRIVKSFCREIYEIKSAREALNNILSLYAKAIRTDSLTSPIMEMLSGIAIAVVIWYGGTQVLNGTTTPGGFFSFIVAFIAAYKPIKSIADLNISLQTMLACAKRVFLLLDMEQKIEKQSSDTNLLPIKGEIEFCNVSFGHKLGHKALKNVSLKIKQGQFIALVGASGSGKSTMIDLIERFYDPEDGAILLDGVDLKNHSLSTIRNNISLVNQDIMLFDASVKENIAYGNLEANQDQIEKAAKIAAADEFIKELSHNYDTAIGQHGINLSGGQKQRLCIARAIVKDSKIIIFDEATSSLDTISEQKIKNSIDNIRKNHTIIVVAHRLSTILDADVIYVMKKGTIVEFGTHQELMTKKGEYFKLYNKQQQDLEQ